MSIPTYEKFEKPKIRTENVHHQMKSSPSYGGRAPAILPISRSLYMKIIGEDLTSEEDEVDTMSMDNYDRALEWKPNLDFVWSSRHRKNISCQ